MKTTAKNWLLVALWMAGMLYFSSRPDPIGHLIKLGGQTPVAIAAVPNTPGTAQVTQAPEPPHRAAWLNNTAHASEYAGLMLLLLGALWAQTRGAPFTAILPAAFGTAISFALLDELYQEIWPSRGFAFSDLGFDLLGIILASILFGLYIAARKDFQFWKK